ncbi:MFS transporter [Nonomuraea endophytica]|uniref:MFS family permease n=1 Tax=Nonomuraea endophytica TaxID=714136 RepID=A0A7W7ZY40_9ACTN|nr:MFS transporter [Nonomuraea endophytica]MBB5075967.1 MFS family permease [Nonomuraea endophytica]
MVLASPAVRSPSRWLPLPVVLVAVFVTTLDFFIANVAIPSIRTDLAAGPAATQLVFGGYGLAYAAGLIISGRLGDLYGARRVFMVGLALFTLASAAAGTAPGILALIVARVVQGSAAALLAPQVLTLIGALYPGADRARAFGWYGTATGVAGVSGQVVGGLLMAADLGGLGWRTVFLINLPIGIAALLAARTVLPELPGSASGLGLAGGGRGLDVAGALMVAGGLAAIVLPLVQGPELGWPLWTWVLLALSAPLLTAFVARQRTRPEPLLDLRVFREPGFAPGLVAVALLFGGSAGLSFVLAVYLQDGLGLGPLAAGMVFTALNAGFFLASLRRGRPLPGALAIVAGLMLVREAVGAGEPYLIAAALGVVGAGMGLLMSPLISTVLAGVRRERAGAAAGVLGTAQETGGVLGGTLTGAVFLAAADQGWTAAAQSALVLLVVVFAAVVAVMVFSNKR